VPCLLRRRLRFDLEDVSDTVCQQPTRASAAADERFKIVNNDHLDDAATSVCNVVDNREASLYYDLNRCQPLPQRVHLCESRSETASRVEFTDNGLTHDDDATDLIGDFSRPYSLAAVVGKHPDLKSISPDVVRMEVMSSFCRN
jgi:hypothetical protein